MGPYATGCRVSGAAECFNEMATLLETRQLTAESAMSILKPHVKGQSGDKDKGGDGSPSESSTHAGQDTGQIKIKALQVSMPPVHLDGSSAFRSLFDRLAHPPACMSGTSSSHDLHGSWGR